MHGGARKANKTTKNKNPDTGRGKQRKITDENEEHRQEDRKEQTARYDLKHCMDGSRREWASMSSLSIL